MYNRFLSVDLKMDASGQIVQPCADIESLQADAKRIEGAFHDLGKKISSITGGKFQSGPLKEPRRIFQKAARKGGVEQVLDVRRGYVLLRNLDQIRRASDLCAQAGLLTGHDDTVFGCLVDTENTFVSPSAQKRDVRCINAKFLIPDNEGTYHLAEIQFIHVGTYPAYQESHGLYEQEQKMQSLKKALSEGFCRASTSAIRRLQKDFNRSQTKVEKLSEQCLNRHRDAAKKCKLDGLVGYQPQPSHIAMSLTDYISRTGSRSARQPVPMVA